MKFKSLPHLLDHFKKEETCIAYFERLRWNGNVTCPHCNSNSPWKTNRGYRCSNDECNKKFTCKVGTVFEGSKIKLRLWIAAIYLQTVHKKGISSVQLALDLGVTQKTAWFMLHRIRVMLKNHAPSMVSGNKTVEVDETNVGGKERNRHKSKKLASPETNLANDGTIYNRKKVVFGIIERGGVVVVRHLPSREARHILPSLYKSIPVKSIVYSDEAPAYNYINNHYLHSSVNHTNRVYVVGEVHTNTIESFWSVLKRCIYGTYVQVSGKHFDAYLNEISVRFNHRHTDIFERVEYMLTKPQGRLLYKVLTAN